MDGITGETATRLIVGLGNPGSKYAATRHNVGFRVIDLVAQRLGLKWGESRHEGQVVEGRLGTTKGGEGEESRGETTRILLTKPQTYMNLSGTTVAGFAHEYELTLNDILVVVDDVALPLGTVRIRRGGSAGGHNGLQDIEEQLGSQAYPRLRVGVGSGESNPDELVEHVLGTFTELEQKALEPVLSWSAEASLAWVGKGIEFAMNRFNTKPQQASDQQEKTGATDQDTTA